MSPTAIAFATLGVLAVWGAVIAGAVRYYIKAELQKAHYVVEMKLRESIQENSNAMNRAWVAIDHLEKGRKEDIKRIDRISARVNSVTKGG